MVAMQRRKMRLVSLTFNEDESSGSGGGSGSGKGKRKAGGERNAQNEARLQNMRMMLLGPTAAKEVIEID